MKRNEELKKEMIEKMRPTKEMIERVVCEGDLDHENIASFYDTFNPVKDKVINEPENKSDIKVKTNEGDVMWMPYELWVYELEQRAKKAKALTKWLNGNRL